MTVTGWPITVISRGEVIVDAARAAGRARPRPLPARAPPAKRRSPPGLLVPEIDPARNFGAELLD